jgi:hypothetical protein|tara:strand:+ start:384 stop:647 length:264 start_codon:yes stop_codon:yes gene_type:complete
MAHTHKLVDGVRVDLTAEEITALNAADNIENERMADKKSEYDSQEYARNRKAEYDQLNQFEMQFDDKKNSTTTWVDKINEIKGRHPK